MCPQEHLSHISNTIGLSFELKRIGPFAALVAALVYLLALFLSAVSNTTENLSASFYSEFLIQITCQHLLLLVGFDTLIYRKYCDTPPILVGHQPLMRRFKRRAQLACNDAAVEQTLRRRRAKRRVAAPG